MTKPSPSANGALSSKWRWKLKKLTRQLWFRAALYAVLAIGTAFLAILVKPYLPPSAAVKIGAESVDAILTIIASSMLTVTTFSLGIMLSAFVGAANSVTPRASRLLLDDSTAQNALATFLGAFLFSLVGIIALQSGAYGEGGRFILFIVTIGVVIVIFVTFIHWIAVLRNFGRMEDTISRVEKAAAESLTARLAAPYLGGNPRRGDLPAGARPLLAEKTGYVQHIDLKPLSQLAEQHEIEIYVETLPGAFVIRGEPLAHIAGPDGWSDDHEKFEAAWSIEAVRSFEQDPRFGFIVLSEVASRALSPAVNDPGTAIEILGRGVRVLSRWGEREEPELLYPRLWIEPLRIDDFFNDFFGPIARDGAAIVELQVRLQKSLLGLAGVNPGIFQKASLRHSRLALDRSESSLPIEADREEVRAIAAAMEAEDAAGRAPAI
jgi:uncharacterized membrane protein